MNWLDIVILVLIIIPTLIGLKTGMTKIVLSLAGLVLGTVLAGHFHGPLAGWLTFIPQANLANIAAFAIILVGVMLVTAVVARLVQSFISAIMLGWLNHLGGAAFGLVFGAVFCGAILAVWVKFLGVEGPITQSVLARLLLDRFPLVLALLPGDFSGLRSLFPE